MWVCSEYFETKFVNGGTTTKFVCRVSLAEGGTGLY
jgi:hypothetical protein